MQFKDIYCPISKDLNLVEKELRKTCENLSTNYLQEIIGYFFKIPGKRLRPTLALLSSGIINNNLLESTNNQLIKYATGLELMHSASLIHDDVLDNDMVRRGQKTLNEIYGNKIAVLAGDVVYSLAFSTLSSSLPKEFKQTIVELIENMCASEVIQAENMLPTREIYLDIIRGKTALFMSVSCKIAAALAGATKEQVNSIEAYGLNLGMAYQIMDDCMDKDVYAELNITSEDAKLYGDIAISSLKTFEDSAYKISLINLVDLILSLSDAKVSNS
ncbi:polyprenyl synthetase family protein [Clostridium estertheticum]|uniref:polyprenyl synthetase family protein n=1 Tax=Clostridium estertheticum TaxID=238834 RepID=UPI001C7E1803|nr:polyprenyl synthetase family protein [Clostridium estertheticum]MBX4270944.1 polyprenyl synthetase family protein [Clostridium estertheticum]WLC81177.1 polyprenyl synthetase family protein [Clostridium estertheticum]